MVATKPRVRASTGVARELGASAMHRWEDYVACGARARQRDGRTVARDVSRVYLENPGYTWLENALRPPGYRADFLNFASDFAPDQLSDSGKLESCQNRAPNTLWSPWRFPETKSAGVPLVSFLVSGNLYAGQ